MVYGFSLILGHKKWRENECMNGSKHSSNNTLTLFSLAMKGHDTCNFDYFHIIGVYKNLIKKLQRIILYYYYIKYIK